MKKTAIAILVLITILSIFSISFAKSTTETSTKQQVEIQKWEYTCLRQLSEKIGLISNSLGKEGWEMVSFAFPKNSVHARICFKRPLK